MAWICLNLLSQTATGMWDLKLLNLAYTILLEEKKDLLHQIKSFFITHKDRQNRTNCEQCYPKQRQKTARRPCFLCQTPISFPFGLLYSHEIFFPILEVLPFRKARVKKMKTNNDRWLHSMLMDNLLWPLIIINNPTIPEGSSHTLKQ